MRVRKYWEAVLRVVAVLAAAAALTESVARATSTDASPLDQGLLQGMQGGSGGAYGYYLKQVNGPVLLGRNDNMVYDPASALKTLLLVYSMRQVASGADRLGNPVTVYVYPHTRSGVTPTSPFLCPDAPDEIPANQVSPAPSLQDVLNGMMQVSDNRFTRAIELRYGRGNLQAFAASLGMGNTRLNQIFGCGWDGDLQNVWTLDDASKLYEALASGQAVPANFRDQLLGFMLGSDFDAVVSAEAARLGIPDAGLPFLGIARSRYKGGDYNICLGNCAADTVLIRDLAGILSLPFQEAKGVFTTDFTWGTFIANVHTPCLVFPCALGDRMNDAVFASLTELFRPAIATALQTWTRPTKLSAKRAVHSSAGLKLWAQLSTQYGGKHPAGIWVQFLAGGQPLCKARTNGSGVATCVIKRKVKATRYIAKFAGSDNLFATAASAAVPRKK